MCRERLGDSVSLGFGGAAHLALSDGRSALYSYSCTNLNKPDNDPREDGEIYVELEPILSAYVPRRTKRYPEGIPISTVQNVDFPAMLAGGSLRVRNCSNASYAGGDGVDSQAWELILMIGLEIQRTGTFPDKVSYFK